MVRHYEAAQVGRRTSSWIRSSSDANSANAPALPALREHSRDLRRNNGWAIRGIDTITNNAVGWGIRPSPKATERSRSRAEQAISIWTEWADSTACDYAGQQNFYGLQRLVMTTVVESGEALVLRQPASSKDGLAIPMKIQVLEPDYLDASKIGKTADGGRIVDGIEFDSQGRRVAYWLFTEHPGDRSMPLRLESVRFPAERILHVYRVDRAGQNRGVPWLASAIARLKNLDEFEDAELLQQQVAACFGAFVTDVDGASESIGDEDEDDDELEHLQPGHISYLPPGRKIEFAQPPTPQTGALPERVLRRIAVSLNVTYEDLSADYSKVNFSSARMARIAHWNGVYVWREHMIVPQLCEGVWRWVMGLAQAFEGWPSIPGADWFGPPPPVLELDKEAAAYKNAIRIGMITWDQMCREQGLDPVAQLEAIKRTNEALDKAGIVLDMDPRMVNSSGQKQATAASATSATDSAAGDQAKTDATDAQAAD
jgi:lambda family phage portal protein